MDNSPGQAIDTAAVAVHHHRLLELARDTDSSDVAAVLALGTAVLLHGSLEPAHLSRALSLADPVVREELRSDHSILDESLRLLGELQESEPGSPDVDALAAAVLARVRAHLERDDRTLYRAANRLDAVRAAKSTTDLSDDEGGEGADPETPASGDRTTDPRNRRR